MLAAMGPKSDVQKPLPHLRPEPSRRYGLAQATRNFVVLVKIGCIFYVIFQQFFMKIYVFLYVFSDYYVCFMKK